MPPRQRLRLLGLILLLCCQPAGADKPLRLAVAANFKSTLEMLLANNTPALSFPVTVSAGSTGALYAQVRNGAPFDIFLAADRVRPEQLEAEGRTRLRTTYAIGRLVFWQKAGATINAESLQRYKGILAIANPRHAPYGAAAANLLAQLNVQPDRVIQGSNVAQAYTFVDTGNAGAGLVALSQVIAQKIAPEAYWLIPTARHPAIEQQLVILNRADARAEALVTFLQSEIVRTQLAAAGYDVPANGGMALGS